jgi:TRAP-type C4-dicarboxylate transport system permease small subunit
MLTKMTERIVKLLSTFCMITIAGLTIIVFIQVATRFLNISVPWTEELARLLLIWLTFIGSSLAFQQKMHLSVNYFVNLATKNLRTMIGLLIQGLMIIFFSILVVYGFKLTMGSMGSTSSTLQWPMGLFYSVIPLSSIISIYFIVINMFHFAKKGETTI